LKDDQGDLVLSRLDLPALDELAAIGGGSAFRVGLDGLAGERLRTVLDRLGQRDFEARRITRYQERYQWPLALALAFLVLAWSLRPRRRPAAILPSPAPARTRRAVLFAALLLPSLTTPAMSELLRPEWAPALERGRQAYARQDYETALLEFEQARAQAPDDPRLALAVGETLFRLDRLEDAALEFERARYLSRTPDLRAESLYNAGTTALAQDDPGTAVDLLRESLRLEPERSDVLHNLEAALLRLQEQQEQQEQQQDQDQGEQDQQQGDQDQQQGDQDQQQDEQDQQQGEQDQQDPGDQPDPQDQPPSDPYLPEEMDLEQALQLLQALDRDEQDLKRSIQQRLRGDGARSGREW
jgi:tetratricopeptide (TPR) repeat protein